MTMPESMPTRTRAKAVFHCRPGPRASMTSVALDHHGAGDGAAHKPEAQRRSGDRDEVEGAPRLAGLEREDRDEPDRDDRVESEQQDACADAGRRVELDHREDAREDGDCGEEPDDRPRPWLVGRREARQGDGDRADDHEHRPQQDEPAARAAKHPVPPSAPATRLRARGSSRQGRRDGRTRRPVRRRHPRCLPRRAH